MAIFRKRAVHTVNHMLTLYYDFVILVVSHFDFEGRTLVLLPERPYKSGLRKFLKHRHFSNNDANVLSCGHTGLTDQKRIKKSFHPLLHRNSTVARRVTKVTSEHYGNP